MSIFVAPRPPKVSVPQKAAYGPGLNYYLTDPPLSAFQNTPQERMRRAMKLGISVPWIRAAERVITGLGSTVDWHLEDENDDEIDDEYQGLEEQRARSLIEKPQALLDIGQRLSRREMWALTLRHVGLCGNAFWLDDQPDNDGLPGAEIYIRPDRMTPAPDKSGNLRGWVIDADDRGGGIPVLLDEVHHFTLEPPDEGFFGVGLVESALLKASLSGALDSYLLQKIQSGGRRSGILAPKTGIIEPDVYDQLVLDWRTASEAQDAARRLQVVRAPVDFHDTGIDELTNMLRDFMTGARDDLLGLWGVPASKLGLHDRGKGLGATAATDSDDETLWEVAVKPRLTAFTETVQMTLLDDWQRIGVTVELEVETPEFDDDTPQFEKAFKALAQPLTNNQRLEILGFDPLPDYGPDGQPLGLAIVMPMTYTVIGQGPEPNGLFNNAPPPEPDPVPVVSLPPPMPQLNPGPIAKATPTQKLRSKVERTSTPVLKEALVKFLAEQKRDIAAKLRAHAEHIAKEPNDHAVWWKPTWDRKLHDVLKPHLAKMADAVSSHIAEGLPAKAVADPVERALKRGSTRVTAINERTQRAIAEFVAQGIAEGLSPSELADRIEAGVLLDNGMQAFDEYRAELIARTELMDAYNGAAIGAYQDAGITRVEAIDGDQDEQCANRNGQVFSLDEADAIEDHPNGTLDWAPVIEEPKAQKAEEKVVAPPPLAPSLSTTTLVFDRDEAGRIKAFRPGDSTLTVERREDGRIIGLHRGGSSLTFERMADGKLIGFGQTREESVAAKAAPPVIEVHPPVVNVAAPNVTVNVPKSSKRIERDERGQVARIVEE